MPLYRSRLGTASPAGPKLVGFDRFADGDREVARQRVQRHRDALRRSVQQEHDLAEQLFLRREIRELLNLGDGDDAAFDDSGLELKCRNVFGDLGERLGERHRVRLRVGDRIRAAQILEQIFRGRAGSGAFREGVFHDLVLAARSLHGAAELGVVFDGDALEGRENHGRDLGQFHLQFV